MFSGPPAELYRCAAALIGGGALLVWVGRANLAGDCRDPGRIERMVARVSPDLAQRVGRSYAACVGAAGVAVGLAFLLAALSRAADLG